MSATPILSNASSSSSGQRQALPASSSRQPAAANGCLRATILSAYDLPTHDPPSYVSITTADQTFRTGPPSQRHRDRNNFKFFVTNGTTNELVITAPLSELHQSVCRIQVVYLGRSDLTLTAEYDLKQLKIHETTWLILHLDGKDAANDEDEEEEDEVPTLRLQLTLTGPYRTEIAALVNLCQAWFGAVDSVEAQVQQVVSKLPRVSLPIDSKYFLVPAVPIAAAIVVSAPVLIGILLAGLPMILPIAVMIGSVLLAAAAVAGLLYSSTETGGSRLATRRPHGLVDPIRSAGRVPNWSPTDARRCRPCRLARRHVGQIDGQFAH